MWRTTLKSIVGPQAAPARHHARRRPGRRVPRPAPSCSATRCEPASTTCSPRPTPAPTPSSAAAPTVGDDDIGERGPLDASLVDDVAAVDGVAAAVPDGRRASARSSDADGDRLGGERPADPGRQLDRRSRAEPLPARRGPGARGAAARSSSTGPRPTRATWPSATPPPCSRPSRSRSTVVGIATFGDDDGLGGATYAAFTLEEAQQLLAAGTGPASPTSSWRPTRREPGRAGRPARRVAARRHRGDHRRRRSPTRSSRGHRGRLPRLLRRRSCWSSPSSRCWSATFSIYNTFSILVAQRTRESALLRAIGASRRQVLALGRGRGAHRRRRGVGARPGRRHGPGRRAAGAARRRPGSPCRGRSWSTPAPRRRRRRRRHRRHARRRPRARRCGVAGPAPGRPARRRRRPRRGRRGARAVARRWSSAGAGVVAVVAGGAAATVRWPMPGSARARCSSSAWSCSVRSWPGRSAACSARRCAGSAA